MKDIVIKASRIRCELWVLLGCLVVAYGMNVYATFHYVRPMKELFTNVGFVIVTALVIYVLILVLRLVVLLIRKLFTKNK